ncbi:MAG: hypothetical protein J6F33_05500 [Acidaminococcaceae bacterium]|nr:hypothetical protein [Acidaminococcaceae bacterium]
MNKLMKLITLFTIVLSMLTIGCGPSKEEQYSVLKKDTIALKEEIIRINSEREHENSQHAFSVRDMEKRKELNKETNQKAFEKMFKNADKINENLKTMDEISKSNSKLAGDYMRTKQEVLIVLSVVDDFRKSYKK